MHAQCLFVLFISSMQMKNHSKIILISRKWRRKENINAWNDEINKKNLFGQVIFIRLLLVDTCDEEVPKFLFHFTLIDVQNASIFSSFLRIQYRIMPLICCSFDLIVVIFIRKRRRKIYEDEDDIKSKAQNVDEWMSCWRV